ncbi:MAG: hypothetical protein JW940_35935 [Polyangiaceae bacterium]|nr:hypothetical protein [Polyangiaceae bacterium]
MADDPLKKLARLLGGVVLIQGRLGHQVLGQLLIANSSQLALAGAAVAVSAVSRQENAAWQATIRILAPAVAVHLLAQQEAKRLERLSERLAVQEQSLDRAAPQRLRHALTRVARAEQENQRLRRLIAELKRSRAAAHRPRHALARAARAEQENQRLRRWIAELERSLGGRPSRSGAER